MNTFSIQQFLQETAQKDENRKFFELEKPQLLEVNLNKQTVLVKNGSMIGYKGSIKFERQGMLSGGVGNLLKKAISGEGTVMMQATGSGQLYVADKGKKVRVIYLENEALCVNGNDILAHEMELKSDITMLKSIAGMLSGGLFQVRLSGVGHVALTTHGDPMTLVVKPGEPVFTDPNATVAWSGNLTPQIKTDVSFKTLLGHSSGESIQMKFEGSGWVLVQPYEEVYTVEK